MNLAKGTNRSRTEFFTFMLEKTESEWEKYVDALLTANVAPPQVPVAQLLGVKCTECPDYFDSRSSMARHRRQEHQYEDLAIKYWKEHRGECPFCRCFFREGGADYSSEAHFTCKPDPREGHEGAGACHAAYLAWEAAGGRALPADRTVRPTVQIAKKAVLISVVDLESEAALRRRVDTWKDAKPAGRKAGPAELRRVHSISKSHGRYILTVSLQGSKEIKRSVNTISLAEMIALRDREFLAAALRL